MPINSGCNSQTPADQFTSIVDSFWLQEPRKKKKKREKKKRLLVRAKKLQVVQHLAQPRHIVCPLPAISQKKEEAKNKKEKKAREQAG